MKKIGLLGIGLLMMLDATAQSLSLKGVSGGKVLVVLGNAQPRFIAAGQSLGDGLVLVKIDGQSATFKSPKGTFVLKVGETRSDGQVATATAPATSVAPLTNHSSNVAPVVDNTTTIQLKADKDGHFITEGLINGKTVKFLLDTGASTIAMSVKDAVRLGIDYSRGTKSSGRTANGVVEAFQVKLERVSINGLELNDVEASVVANDFSSDSTMLLGMSFLSRVKMTFDQNMVVLEKK